MHRQMGGPTSQKINPRSPQLAGTRPRQHETDINLLLNHPVYNFEQFGKFLHFINDNITASGIPRNEFPEPLRAGRHLP